MKPFDSGAISSDGIVNLTKFLTLSGRNESSLQHEINNLHTAKPTQFDFESIKLTIPLWSMLWHAVKRRPSGKDKPGSFWGRTF